MTRKLFRPAVMMISGLLHLNSAQATPYYCPEYATVPPLGSTTSSLIAASAMAAHCFGKGFVAPSPLTWDSSARASYTTDCVSKSIGTNVVWPGSCNPNGALGVLNNRTGGYGHFWVPLIRPSTATDMGRLLLDKMKQHKTPIILPLFGNWDHWVTVTYVDTGFDPRGAEQFRTVRLHDGLPIGVIDRSGKASYGSPYTVQSAFYFVRDYMGIMSYSGAPCHREDIFSFTCGDPPHNDPWYLNWLFLYEPPAGMSLVGERETTTPLSVMRAPGVAPKGQRMTAALALRRVSEALRLSGADEDVRIRQMLAGGTTTQAVLVRRNDADNSLRDYFLLPVNTPDGRISGFIQLSAEDGAFESAQVFDRAIGALDFAEESARQRAQTLLSEEELLGAGVLSWRPIAMGGLSDTPVLPYYEFQVYRHNGELNGSLRIALHDPKLSRRITTKNQQQ